MSSIDWEQHKYSAGAECIFSPRETFQGRAMLPGLAAHAGESVRLIALWKMSEDDPYPGEWALGAPDRCSLVLGRAWVASGDVTPNA
jgi:hypothetical protein